MAAVLGAGGGQPVLGLVVVGSLVAVEGLVVVQGGVAAVEGRPGTETNFKV